MQAKIKTSQSERVIERQSFSVIEVAEAHGLSPSFIRLEIARGRLRAMHAGRRVLIPRRSLDEYFGTTLAK